MSLEYYAKNIYPVKLTKTEKDAILTYTAEHFGINNCLRRNTPSRVFFEEQILAIDSAISKFDLRRKLVVYRNLMFLNRDMLNKYLYSVKKGSFLEKAYSSCSTNTGLYGEASNVKLKILLEPKVNGAYIKYISSMEHENEFLLARNTTFETISCCKDEDTYKILCKVKK